MGLFHQGLTGILPVSNFDEVRAFYEDRLGLVKTQEWTDREGNRRARYSVTGGGFIELHENDRTLPQGPTSFWMEAADINGLYSALQKIGGMDLFDPIEDKYFHARSFQMRDPAGNATFIVAYEKNVRPYTKDSVKGAFFKDEFRTVLFVDDLDATYDFYTTVLEMPCVYARNTGIHAHLCENRNEVSFCLQNYKLRPVELMEKVGMLGPRLVTAHNVALSEHDITLLSKYRVKLIHCPFANLINHGFPKTPTLLESGCYVGLGSDGAAYNSVDLFEEMRVLRACLISYYGLPAFDPVVMPVKTALRLSTEGGAAALGMEDCLGRVKEGCIADLITVNMMRPHIFPTNNRTTAVLDTVTAQDVEDSIIDGKLIMEHRILKTIDEEAVMKECAARMQSINRQFQ